MIKNSNDEIQLPADRAFVLQFKSVSDNHGSSYAGRIEHIASGKAELFYSTEEMCIKLRAMLNQQKNDADKSGRND